MSKKKKEFISEATEEALLLLLEKAKADLTDEELKAFSSFIERKKVPFSNAEKALFLRLVETYGKSLPANKSHVLADLRHTAKYYLTAEESDQLDTLVVEYQQRSGALKEITAFRIVEIMQRYRPRFNSAENTAEVIQATDAAEIAAFNYTITAAMKSFDPAKGSFIRLFFHIYEIGRIEGYRSEEINRKDLTQNNILEEYVMPKVDGLYAYTRMDSASEYFPNPLIKNETYQVYGKDIIGNETWYHIKKDKISVYIPASNDLFHKQFTRYVPPADDEDDPEFDHPDPKDPSGLGNTIRQEHLDLIVFPAYEALSLCLKMHEKKHRSAMSTCSGGQPPLTKYSLYRMLFTDYLMHSLKELGGEGMFRGYRHENMLMSASDHPWMDHLTITPCRNFQAIITTHLHTTDHFLQDGNMEEVLLPVPYTIRKDYLDSNFSISLTPGSLKSTVSTIKSDFEDIYYSQVSAVLRT